MVYKNLTELIGHTPLLEIGPFEGQRARILAKVEYFNPGGSVKDRVALAMMPRNRASLFPVPPSSSPPAATPA